MIPDLRSRVRAVFSAVLFAMAPVAGQDRSLDIVFVYDNSASMWAHYARIDSATGDTAFYYGPACTPRTLPAQPVPFTYSTQIGPMSIHLIDSTTLCGETAGDPYVARTTLIARAIDYLSAHAPNSNAGALAFANTVEHEQPPLPLSVPGNADRVKDSLALDSIRQTIYTPALAMASLWLQDPDLSPHPKKAIVFLSDGQPADIDAATRWLAANTGIPVYGIALGDTSRTLAFMIAMAESTGGRYFAMPPNDLTRMDRVMDAILAQAAGLAPASRPPRLGHDCGTTCPAVDATGRLFRGPAPIPRYPLPARR